MPEQEERIRCRYCGSNNFAGTPACWQCNRPLLISQNAPNPNAPLVSPQQTWPDRPSASPSPSSFVRPIDTSVADKSAIALGLLFPCFGYPVGFAFMMMDDQRKAQLGRLTLLWSTIGLVLSVVISLILGAPLLAIGGKMLPSPDSLTKQLNPSGDSN